MHALLSALGSLVNDPTFWRAVLAVVGGLIFVPGGVAQRVVTLAARAISDKLQHVLPQQEYLLAKQYAGDAVAAAFQLGSSIGWSNDQKKASAEQQLKDTLHAHGITRFDDALGGVIEAAWLKVKPALTLQAAYASAAAPVATSSAISTNGQGPALDESGAPHAPVPTIELTGALAPATSTTNPANADVITTTAETPASVAATAGVAE